MKSGHVKSFVLAMGMVFSLSAVAQSNSRPENVTTRFGQGRLAPRKPLVEKSATNTFNNPKLETKVQTGNRMFVGGVNGGGGNVLRSTQEEVKNYLETVRMFEVLGGYEVSGFILDLARALEEIEMIQHNSEAFPVPTQIKRILSRISVDRRNKMKVSPYSVGPMNRSATYDLKEFGVSLQIDKPCFHNGEEKDGSYDEQTKKICISVKRLTAYSKEVLLYTVLPLFVHEMAHEAGLGEEDAVLAQQYFLKKLSSSRCEMSIQPSNQEGGQRGSFTVGFNSQNQIEMILQDIQTSMAIFQKHFMSVDPKTSWFVNRGIVKPGSVPRYPGDNVVDGVISSSRFNIHWNSDLSGDLEFDSVNMDPKGEPSIVRNKILWRKPGKNQAGFYETKALPGTSLTIKGYQYTSENSYTFIEFRGHCFE